MKFNLIDLNNWERTEYYNHYLNNVVCSYSLTSNIDISNLEKKKLYPAMLWLLTATVNEIKEFRTSLESKGIGIFESMHPSYTIFNKVNKNFSVIWTEYDEDYNVFLNRYNDDIIKYSSSTKFLPKAGKPLNTFDVSMLPWATFTSFNLNIHNNGKYLLPIFTMGKFFKNGKKTMLPLAIQVHHSVCDGYHVGLFLEILQNKIENFIL